MEEKHISENRIVFTPGTYSIFGTKENTKPPEINALPLDSVIGSFKILAVNEHPSAYGIVSIIAYGDWWTLYDTGLLEIYCVGDMPNYNEQVYGRVDAPWKQYKPQITAVNVGSDVTSIGDYAFLSCTALTNVIISDSVTSIGKVAFSHCNALTNVTIPDSVTSIGSHAFSYCYALTDMIIPDSVTSIGDYAFDYCIILTNVTIPDSVTSIGAHAFSGCYRLTRVIIPANLTSISGSVFNNCTGLTSVTIPDSVTSIESYAFYLCNNLTDVYYGGSDAQWGAISIGSYNTPLRNATIHYNSTGPT